MITVIGAALDAVSSRLPWLRKALPWLRKALLWLGIASALVLAVKLAAAWHDRRIEAVMLAARQEQAAADTKAFIEAQAIATDEQARIVKVADAKGAAITERISHDFEARIDAIDRTAAAKLRAHAAREANRGAAGQGGTVEVSDAAGGNPESYCAATGWLPFGRALTMATDAEHDAEQARQCAAWVVQQQSAWPQ